MQIKDGKPAPYLTKVQYIEALEQALQAIAQCQDIEQARLIVSAVPQRGGRWRKASPLSHAELMKAAEGEP